MAHGLLLDVNALGNGFSRVVLTGRVVERDSVTNPDKWVVRVSTAEDNDDNFLRTFVNAVPVSDKRNHLF